MGVFINQKFNGKFVEIVFEWEFSRLEISFEIFIKFGLEVFIERNGL